MSDVSQLVLPPSFVAMFVPPGCTKPTASREEMWQRYELCEDLACALTDRARTIKWELDIAEDDVLERVHHGLCAPMAALSEAEVHWVLRRLAELLDWPPPGFLEPLTA